ncbi:MULTISPECIES: hypothetical protein [unclassified Egicoccus]|uniref:hypothetical protein n=1 Tax=unclassified Egicoccus TaxID=2635606 RepID=UPI00359DCEBE
MSAAEIAARVASSRAEAGLPRHVQDPVVLADIAALLRPRLGLSRPAAASKPAGRDATDQAA